MYIGQQVTSYQSEEDVTEMKQHKEKYSLDNYLKRAVIAMYEQLLC